jgi:hypothetical protein
MRNAADQPLGHFLVGGLHSDIVDAGVFLNTFSASSLLVLNINAFEIGFHELDHDIRLSRI